MDSLENIGRYQWLVLLVFGLQILAQGMNVLIVPFTHKEVPHRCFTEKDKIKGLEKNSIVSLDDFLDIFPTSNEKIGTRKLNSEDFLASEINDSGMNSTDSMKFSNMIPHGNSTIEAGRYQKEYWRKLLGADYSGCEKLDNNSNLISCDSYVFTSSEYLRPGQNSIIRDFGLFCGKENHWAGKINMIGMFLGSIIGCPVSDQVGRKTVLFTTLVLKSAMFLLAAMSNNFWFYGLSLTIGLSASMAQYLVMKVYITEVFPTKTRGSIMAFATALFPVGYGFVSLVAWIFPDWRDMYFALAAINIFPVLGYLFFHESPRWLQSKGRKNEAELALDKISKFNGIDSDGIKLEENEVSPKQEQWLKVFKKAMKNKIFLKNITLMIIVWTNCSFVYYAISFAVGDQKGSMYR